MIEEAAGDLAYFDLGDLDRFGHSDLADPVDLDRLDRHHHTAPSDPDLGSQA